MWWERLGPPGADWMASANAWARHFCDCDPCFLGKPCDESDRLLAIVTERFAALVAMKGRKR
jgi:hypothetical protein